MHVSVADRAAYLLGAVRRRYRRVLAMPHWDNDELATVSRGLAKAIDAKLRLKTRTQTRIERLQTVAFLGDEAVEILTAADRQEICR
jgi:hypothetical protein